MKPRTDKPCRVCGEPVRYRSGGLSTRIHNQCRPRKTASAPERKSPPYRLTRVARPGQAGPAQQKQPPHRNRALLDLAHALHECMACGKYVAEGLVPAHANWGRFGKGARLKAHDCFFAAMCNACHSALDQGSRMSETERQEMWQRAFEKTLLALWERGLIKVAA